ncbi:DinB family protein [Tamlana sp. I1]|uniref:DinB family protein n=1 Tax=Tamlana sp. I1 TaxID=2762061 RepID=UPI0018907348|nr:DinB family protein [Tamlana sp. I1]
MTNKRLKSLHQLLSKLEDLVDQKDLINPKISKATIGWQIDHSLKVIHAVCSALIKSNPEDYHWNFNTTRLVIFAIGRFPKGKVKAPKSVVSQSPDISKANLIEQLNQAKTGLELIEKADKHAFFKHHIFGKLTRNQTIHFLELHTKHHFKIINAILLSYKP